MRRLLAASILLHAAVSGIVLVYERNPALLALLVAYGTTSAVVAVVAYEHFRTAKP